MQLGFFTEEAYERLLDAVEDNKDKYESEDEWLASFFGRGAEYYGLSTVEVSKFIPYYSDLKSDEDIRNEDLANARKIYEAFKLTPLQATNKYMWSYLCHADKECRRYIQHRWAGSDIKQRYFVPGEGDGLYFFNALSRLWWWAHITYDPNNNANHYALTEVLFSNQMVGKDFLGTLNKANYSRMKGVLLALKDFKETLAPREGINQYFRSCNKILNQKAAISMFDYLDYEDIYQLTYSTLEKVRSDTKKED